MVRRMDGSYRVIRFIKISTHDWRCQTVMVDARSGAGGLQHATSDILSPISGMGLPALYRPTMICPCIPRLE